MVLFLLLGLAEGFAAAGAPTAAFLDDFKSFKLHLARDQVGFIERCAEANSTLDTEITCGNTMTCFLRLVSPRAEVESGADARNFSAALAADYEDGPALRALVGAGPHPGPSNYVHLLRTADGRRFLQRWPQATAARMRAELLRDEALTEPRIFTLMLQWFEIKSVPDLRGAEALNDAVLQWLIDSLAAREPDYERPEPRSMNMSFAMQMVVGQVTSLVRDGGAKFPQDPCFQRQEACVTFQWPNKVRGGLFSLEMPLAQLRALCAALPALPLEPGFTAWRGCAALQISTEPLLAPDQDHWQNHVLAIIKHPGQRFEVLQGYIANEGVERGYDLVDWICSSNKFAALQGFGPDTMAEFLGHLDTFAANAALGASGAATFDGANHAATFLVSEAGFAGKPYFGTMDFNEIVADEDASPVLRQMVREVDGPPPQLGQLCRDAAKIHGGKLMPGEVRRAASAPVRPKLVRTEFW